MRTRPFVLTCWACLAPALLAAALTVAPAGAQTVAITGGRVFPVSAPPIENGTVLIVDGKIAAVGANVTVPAGATRIDARGRWVTPGLIHSSTRLGLVEIDMVEDTNDAGAGGERQVAAGFRSWEGLNPAAVLWAPARNDGITTVLSLPAGGLFAGQAAMIDTREGDRPGTVGVTVSVRSGVPVTVAVPVSVVSGNVPIRVGVKDSIGVALIAGVADRVGTFQPGGVCGWTTMPTAVCLP